MVEVKGQQYALFHHYFEPNGEERLTVKHRTLDKRPSNTLPSSGGLSAGEWSGWVRCGTERYRELLGRAVDLDKLLRNAIRLANAPVEQ